MTRKRHATRDSYESSESKKRRRPRSGESDSDKIVAAIGRLQGNVRVRAAVEEMLIEQ